MPRPSRSLLRRLLRGLPIPLLAALVGLSVGLLVLGVLDRVQTRALGEIFSQELGSRVEQQAPAVQRGVRTEVLLDLPAELVRAAYRAEIELDGPGVFAIVIPDKSPVTRPPLPVGDGAKRVIVVMGCADSAWRTGWRDG